MKKRIVIISLTILLTVAVLWFLTLLFMPKYAKDHLPEGALIAEYYDETTDHDVIFVGDCEIYESFIPEVLWNEYGITAYDRGSAQQLIWQSYYLMEDMFSRESPKVVVFNVYSIRYGEPQNPNYNRMTLDGMKWSGSKWNAVRASLCKDESFLSYVFPLLRYHSRWKELNAQDFIGVFRKQQVSHSGYLMQTDVVPKTSVLEGAPLEDPALPEIGFAYLDKMKQLCEQNGATLILVKSPTNIRKYWWYDEWDEQISDYAERNQLTYINFIPLCDEIGIDWSTDTYDEGFHLNVYGAEKLTSYFGKYLSEQFDFPQHDGETAEVWKEKYESYIKEKNGD